MRNRIIIVATWCLLLGGISPGVAQSPSLLSQGSWYKFSVTEDGVVRINSSLLRTAGINPDQIDPRNIKIYTGQYGMLPQSNADARKNHLTEIAISVNGEADGRFNNEDFILFFAKGPDTYRFNVQKQVFEYSNNLFTDKNFYFLTVSAGAGKRITDQENISGTHPVIQQFDDIGVYETERYNLLKSGRQWFGEQFDATLEATVRFDIAGIVENSTLRFVSHVMAQSTMNSSFQVFFNNNSILTQDIIAVPNTTYGIKGRVKADTISLSANTIGAPGRTSQEIKYRFTKGSSGLSQGYLDFFLLSMKRRLALYGDQTLFRSSESLAQAVSSFQIAGASAGLRVWNITDPDLVSNQPFTLAGTTITYAASTATLQEFSVFNPDRVGAPSFESVVSNQNLQGITAPALLVITHTSLLEEAQRLAAHRQSHNGLSTHVVTVDRIYNEYSGGKQDFTALRDFIKELYDQPGSPLKNVLLFGRGSYDYKNRLLENTNFVPIYESRNSLSPLETYSSDDYYAFLEAGEGQWAESPAQNHTMDIGIGRLPVKTLEEARVVVDKLIDYGGNAKSFGSWQNDFLFVADDGDFNIHQSQADQLANWIEQFHPEFNSKKFFLDNYEQIDRPSGQSSPAASKALDQAVRKGAVIINYTGHGSEQVWMDERILDEATTANWKNKPQYPLFVTATCEFGRHDDPRQITTGEKTLLDRKGGSIGLVTTARPVNSSTNFTLNKAFYEALFTKSGNRFRDMGSVFKDTKNSSISGVANRNFSLLADPSMYLAMAESQIVFDDVQTSTGSPELKALSKVTVSGHIERSGQPETEFSGEVELTLFDKALPHATKGDESTPFNYSERSNLLFKGKASVTQGVFDLSFVMPQNISSELFTGKFNAFAFRTTGEFAGGTQLNSFIGGMEANPVADNTAPSVRLYMGDTTFINGGTVGPDTKIVALFRDESGINISSLPEGNSITATLDNGASVFELNGYFVSDRDTYKKGMLSFPLTGLEKGRHTITLTASDTYNNISTVTVDFVVTDGIEIQIEEFSNYPNPFLGSTTLEFTHSRPGEDLEAFLSIYNTMGELLFYQYYSVEGSQYRVTLAEWDGKGPNGTKLGQGVYLGKLSVRSLLDGSKNERFAKLIILN